MRKHFINESFDGIIISDLAHELQNVRVLHWSKAEVTHKYVAASACDTEGCFPRI